MTTIRTLELTLQWLDNLERVIGAEALIDAMPNDFRGRLDLRAALGELRGKPTPGPWHVDQGHIRDKAGNALAFVPYTLGDDQDRANALLMASAPALAAQVAQLCGCLGEAISRIEAAGGQAPQDWALEVIEGRGMIGDLEHQARRGFCAECGRLVLPFDREAKVIDGRPLCGECAAKLAGQQGTAGEVGK